MVLKSFYYYYFDLKIYSDVYKDEKFVLVGILFKKYFMFKIVY
jgi:hypothetical protein